MRLISYYIILLLLASCATPRRAERHFYKNLKTEIEASPVFSRGFTGFHLVDAASGQTLAAVNADQYFTPASNTKILTLATCLKVLGDSLPGMKWKIANDTFFFRGTGDPTFLHPDFENWQPAVRFLKRQPLRLYNLQFYEQDYMERFGPGWAWDDYAEYYSPERSSMPAYGNVTIISKKKGEKTRVISPAREFVWDMHVSGRKTPRITRAEDHSTIYVQYDSLFIDSIEFERAIPFHLGEFRTPPLVTFKTDSLYGVNWKSRPGPPGPGWKTFYSCPTDTVYRRMMYESDNFVAEQLLLVCAGVKYDTLQQEKIIAWVKDSLFGVLPNPPRWVDGSGLSRYNLITPRYLTAVLQTLFREQPRDRLFSLFPAGGVAGTLAEWYRGPDGQPFVFAKSGSMSGVQCLSGYSVTKSGKVLIFSFMHNNFVGNGKPWKQEMQRFLLRLADR